MTTFKEKFTSYSDAGGSTAAAIWLLNRGRGKIIIAVSHFADDSKTDGSEVAYGTREPHQVPNCLKFRCQSSFPTLRAHNY